jgi:hypothetical protein
MALYLLLRGVNELVARAIGELSFVAWLLVKGVRVRRRDELVPAVAA